jgi:hypothetical protein
MVRMVRWWVPLCCGLLGALAPGCRPASDSTTPPRTPASAEECERVAAHLVWLVEAELVTQGHASAAKQAADGQHDGLLASCLEHADVVAARCLLSARSIEETTRCGTLDPALQLAPRADERPDQASCQRFADHVVALMREDLGARGLYSAVAEDEHAPLLRACLGEATNTEVECGLKATTITELGEC